MVDGVELHDMAISLIDDRRQHVVEMRCEMRLSS